MGRHSAPDSESELSDAPAPDPSDAPTVVLDIIRSNDPPTGRGRHQHAADDDDHDDGDEPNEPARREAAAREPGGHQNGVRRNDADIGADDGHAPSENGSRPMPRPEGATHADLRLLRENPALRARCVAAVIVPFLLYTAALMVIGATASYLVWVWMPTVVAGVSVGTFLDVAHRRER
jgi:hypothetical protein